MDETWPDLDHFNPKNNTTKQIAWKSQCADAIKINRLLGRLFLRVRVSASFKIIFSTIGGSVWGGYVHGVMS